MKDCVLIEAFVAHLASNGHPDLKVDDWPDKRERNNPDIDAIAGPFAIEHTSVDTLPGQREKSDWFMQAAGGLEMELSRNIPFRLNITLQYDSITTGQDWGEIRSALKNWIIIEAPELDDGRHVISNAKGIPFALHVSKAGDRPPRLFFNRYGVSDDALSNRIKKQFDRKIKKLESYTDKIKVLLVESDDIALMNEGKMMLAIEKAYPTPPPGVDQIWYADTSIPGDEIVFARLY